jgi:hypothetical protein
MFRESVALRIRSELQLLGGKPTVPSLAAQSRWALSRRPPLNAPDLAPKYWLRLTPMPGRYAYLRFCQKWI